MGHRSQGCKPEVEFARRDDMSLNIVNAYNSLTEGDI